MLGDQLDALVVAIAGDAFEESTTTVAIRLRKGRNDSQRRQARKRFDVVWGLDRIVEIFAKEGQTDAA